MRKLNFSSFLFICLTALYICSGFTTERGVTISNTLSNETCPAIAVATDILIAEEVTITASNLILSSQTIAQNSQVVYATGSGTELSFGTNLPGPSEGFQIFSGSTLEIIVEDCN